MSDGLVQNYGSCSTPGILDTHEVAGFMTNDEIYRQLVLCNSYTRMGVILNMVKQIGPGELWLRILGENWTGCDNIFDYQAILKHLLPKSGPVTEMMTAEELAVYELLPETVTIYRGCGKKNRKGASWSLIKDVAAKFPFLKRYVVPCPMLITATVQKCQIMAVKLDRNESEIITFSPRIVKSEQLNSSHSP
ncbi:hypothetical protein [Geotalea sp. SG265]|uniref:hypothetical protein n=1 Tax=Geotalea sp. SG265 TaxID=2922867 RepID=UPI001FAE777E|nr:hypothetical protein [Geotalea sp. SG265]